MHSFVRHNHQFLLRGRPVPNVGTRRFPVVGNIGVKVIKSRSREGVSVVRTAFGKAGGNGVCRGHHNGILGINGKPCTRATVIPQTAAKVTLAHTVSTLSQVVKGSRIVDVDAHVLASNTCVHSAVIPPRVGGGLHVQIKGVPNAATVLEIRAHLDALRGGTRSWSSPTAGHHTSWPLEVVMALENGRSGIPSSGMLMSCPSMASVIWSVC